jgi:hypothetical protein
MPLSILLAMQSAGMIFDFFGTKNQDELMKMGMRLQQAGIESDIEMTRLQSQEESLAATQNLRQTMGTQIAAMAARGTRAGAGSAFSLLTQSFSNYNQDEKIRALNLLARENQLKAKSVMSGLDYSAESSKLWQGFASRTINRLSSSADAYYKQANSKSKSNSQGYGLTSAGA